MLKLGSIVIGAHDVERAAQFYRQALGYVNRYEPEDGWASLKPDDGNGPNISIDASRSPVNDHPRIHLDLYAGDATDQAAEIARLISLGASHVDWPDYPSDADFVVLADPEGNRFCVIDTGGIE